MVSMAIRMAALLALTALPALVRAQDVPPGPQNVPPGAVGSVVSKIRVDQGGALMVSDHVGLVFGGIKQGSGPALGPALSHTFGNGTYTQIKAAYSTRSFKLLQGRVDSPPLAGTRLTFSTRLRWQDAPQLSLYRLGIDSPNLRAESSERKSEWSGVARYRLGARSALLAGTGLERYATDGGWIEAGEDDVLDGVPQTPGLGTKPWFVHGFVEIVQDSRLSPDFSRRGRLLDAAWHSYHDGHDGQQSFQRLAVAAYQLVPWPGDNGALGFGARAWLSSTSDGREVPFFLMPTLGGGDYLRAYSSYRFRDRNAALFQAEYRYAVHPMLDVAGLYEAGTVAASAGGLSLRNMAQSVAAGIRVHTKTSGLLRADLARGRDGFKVAFGVGLGGS
jgi:hypothetical protein